MTNPKIIINKVVSDITQKSSFQSEVYRDEPILTTASRLKTYVPQEITEMKRLASSYEAFAHSGLWLFYTQGKLMENYEDDFEYKGDFLLYYPTYRSMTSKQLRGYFSWRTRVRHGEILPTSLSFVYLYIYELLNMIGVSSAEDGYNKLVELRDKYREFDSSIDRYLKRWLVDYIVYYNLDKSLLNNSQELLSDRALITLMDYKNHGNDEIFSAISSVSSYNIENSKFYKQYPEDVKTIVCGVFGALETYYAKHGKKTLFEKLFGVMTSSTYYIFEGAVFYEQSNSGRRDYVIDEIRRYSCCGNAWRYKKYDCIKSRRLGAVIKAADAAMRKRYGFKSQLKDEPVTKILSSIIEKEIDALLAQKEKNARPEIKIDIKKLSAIRKAADTTRDKLIVEEVSDTADSYKQPDLFTQESEAEEPVCEPLLSHEEPSEDVPLDDTERELLKCLLYGRPYGELTRSRGVMLSIAVDSINEKLYDMFADTVIAFEGDAPVLIDDYTDQLKGLIGE